MKKRKTSSLFPETTPQKTLRRKVSKRTSPSFQTPGRRLRQVRKEMGLSQEAFAFKCEMTKSQISRLEADIYRVSADHALQMSSHLSIDWIWLLTGSRYPKPQEGNVARN